MCEAVRQAVAYLFVSTTMWSTSWGVKKQRNISVGLDATGNVGPVGSSTVMLFRVLDYSIFSSAAALHLPLPLSPLPLPPRVLPQQAPLLLLPL